MKSIIMAAALFRTEPFVPDIVKDLTSPMPRPPREESLKRVPWTEEGGQFFLDAAREMCQGSDATTHCLSVEKGNLDRGWSVHDNKTGNFLFYMDRAVAEEVQQDYAVARNTAEEHHPYSMYVARLETKKSQLDYLALTCTSGFGTYCGAMAAKLEKFKVTILLGCTVTNGLCQKYVIDEKAKLDKEIKRVLDACGKGDQACFDAITGGKETEARAESSLEKSSGARPPHTPSRPGFRPTFIGDEGVYEWGTVDCEHCKITEYDEKTDGA